MWCEFSSRVAFWRQSVYVLEEDQERSYASTFNLVILGCAADAVKE